MQDVVYLQHICPALTFAELYGRTSGAFTGFAFGQMAS
jgi:hypothetical protein